MELRQYLYIVKRWAWLVIVSVLIAGASSYLASRAATPLYRTKTTLMVGKATQNPDPNSADLYTGQQLAYTYSQLARREPVLKGSIESLGLQMGWEALANQVSTNIVPQTQLLEIYVIDVDPYRAKVLADAIAQELILQSPSGMVGTSNEEISFIRDQMAELQGKIKDGDAEVKRLKQELDAANSALLIQDLQNQINVLETKISGWQSTYSQLLVSLQGGNVNTLSVVEEATIPSVPISPNVKMNVLLAAAIGLILAVGGIFLMEYLDDTIKTPEDIKKATNLPTMGKIAKIKGNNYQEKLVTATKPTMPIVEAFRSLRTNIQYSSIDKPIRSLLITSPSPREGKSICMANLAVVMAQSGIKVILVDADCRRPIQDQIFGILNNTGLSDLILEEHHDVLDKLQTTDVENLRVLTTGPLPSHPDNLFTSNQMKVVLQKLEAEADMILVDSPPVFVGTDAAILGTQVDGVILLLDAGHTRMNEAKYAATEIRRMRSNLIGVILNRAPSTSDNHYYYSYYYQDNGKEHKKHTHSNGREKGRFLWQSRHRSTDTYDEGTEQAELGSRLGFNPAQPLDQKAVKEWLEHTKPLDEDQNSSNNGK